MAGAAYGHSEPEHGESTLIRTRCPLSLFSATTLVLGLDVPGSPQPSVEVLHKTVKVGDLDIFYRQAGPKDALYVQDDAHPSATT